MKEKNSAGVLKMEQKKKGIYKNLISGVILN
jgi:hypothetical protein